MIYALKFSLFMIVFGGLFFTALTSYLPLVTNPTWPFYIFLYLGSLVIILFKFKSKVSLPDFVFVFFIFYILLSFIFYGLSASSTFYYYLIFFIIFPYISGKAIGKYIKESDFNILFFIALITLIPLFIEIALNPSILFNDRLIVFTPEDYEGVGGSPTSINMNLIFGPLALVCFSQIFIFQKKKSYVNILFFIISIFIIFLFASRSALIAILLTFFIAFLLSTRISFMTILKIFFYSLISIFFFLFIFLNFLSEERASFFYEIPFALLAAQDLFGCNLAVDGSIVARILLWSEALSLFVENIFFGVGSSNFGHSYCGQTEDLASPHMYVLHVMSELGLVGLIIYILFVYSILKTVTINNLHQNSESLFILLIIWIFYTAVSQLNGNYFYDLHLFILSGLLISKSHTESNKQVNT